MKISVCLLTKSYELKCIYFFCHLLKKLLYNGDSSKGDDGDALFIWNNWTTYINSFDTLYYMQYAYLSFSLNWFQFMPVNTISKVWEDYNFVETRARLQVVYDSHLDLHLVQRQKRYLSIEICMRNCLNYLQYLS